MRLSFFLSHLEDDSDQGGDADEYNGVPLFGLLYYIGSYPKDDGKDNAFPVEAAQDIARGKLIRKEQVGEDHADASRGNQTGGCRP